MTAALGRLTRRHFGQLALGLAASAALPRLSFAQVPTETPLHGLSAFGDLKYPADYARFDYANPDAPNGGRIVMTVPYWYFNQSSTTFDTLNTFVLQGNAPPRIERLYEGLMTSAWDEPDALYGCLAKTVTMSADRNLFTFELRPEARFSTGEVLKPEDVVFSYETLKAEGHPQISTLLTEVVEVRAEGEDSVSIRFSGEQTIATVLSALTIPILRAGFFEGREFARTGLTEIPGTGPSRVGAYEPGRFIEYERRDDYWAADMPFARGLDHFQTLRVEFFRNRQAELQAFQAGLVTYRQEFTTAAWATEYRFPAVTQGRVKLNEFPRWRRPSFQCWAFNQRRERFADPRVRRALNLCFDFEWTNANLMYGLRIHNDSPFENSEFKAEGVPSSEELALLEPLRDRLSPEVFGEVWVQRVTDGSGRDRQILREASDLLAEAGWTRSGRGLVNAAGETFRLEYLMSDPEQVRVYGPMIENLRLVGLQAEARVVDAAQYQLRRASFDFDMILTAYGLLPTPTADSLSYIFGSRSAQQLGSWNLAGMADPAVDELIRAAGRAQSREELVTAIRCIDRVVRTELYWVPNIGASADNVAHWDMFGYAETRPDYFAPPESLWWYDADKARAIGRG